MDNIGNYSNSGAYAELSPQASPSKRTRDDQTVPEADISPQKKTRSKTKSAFKSALPARSPLSPLKNNKKVFVPHL